MSRGPVFDAHAHTKPYCHVCGVSWSPADASIPDLVLKHPRIFEYKVTADGKDLAKGKARIQVRALTQGAPPCVSWHGRLHTKMQTHVHAHHACAPCVHRQYACMHACRAAVRARPCRFASQRPVGACADMNLLVMLQTCKHAMHRMLMCHATCAFGCMHAGGCGAQGPARQRERRGRQLLP